MISVPSIPTNFFGLYDMRKMLLFLMAFMLLFLSSCQVIGAFFKAGVIVGVLIVLAIIGLIIFFILKTSGR
jgi:hypothetical protein